MSVAKKILLLISDVILLYAALAATLFIRYGANGFFTNFQNHLFPFSIIFILWLLTLYLFDLYRAESLRDAVTLIKNLASAIAISALISTAAFYLFSGFFLLTPKTNLFIFSVVFFSFAVLLRSVIRFLFASGSVRTAIIGTSPLIPELEQFLDTHPHIGYRIRARDSHFSYQRLNNLQSRIAAESIRLIVIQTDGTTDENSRIAAVYKLLPLGINIMNLHDFYELVFRKIPLNELRDEWFITNIVPYRPIYDAVKRLLDILLSVILVFLTLPLSAFAMLGILITSPGTIFYKQKRFGKNSVPFTLYKFRTMKEGHEGGLATDKNHPRLTPFGRFLRLTHIDEIPQLINILKNDISFIGPRPERIELAEIYRTLPHYDIRHIIKPGLTGWAQVNFRPSTNLEEAYQKLQYDIYYVKNRSLFLDFLIVLKTIRYFFGTHK